MERPADEELYRRLRAGDDCFVLNSRQMGKSSLRVRTMRRLEAEGVVCAVIDPQSRGTSPTGDQWYAGTIKRLLGDLDLTEVVTFSAWWKDAAIQVLSPVNRFEEFIDKILLSLSFDTDGFFGMIRSLHERRTERPNYQRLSFCFLGIATPYDLIRDQNRSVFNIDHAVELTGLDRRDTKPLLPGLVSRVADPSAVLDAVLHWSDGQPFLTQKLWSLVSAHCDQDLPAGELVATIAGEQIIRNWEFQDLPVHLRTIRDRLLQGDERHKGRLPGLVQSIQERGEIPADASREQMQLRLAGLVVTKEGQLRIYNPIYAAVFNPAWMRSQLSELRPPIYGEAIRAWESAAHPERPSHLIRGTALEEALRWAKGKSLSPADRERAQVAERDNRLAERAASNCRKLSVVLNRGMVALTGLSAFAWHPKQLAQWRVPEVPLMSEATKTPVEALIRAIAMKSQTDRPGLKEHTIQAMESFAKALVIVFEWGEGDRLIGHKDAIGAAMVSPDIPSFSRVLLSATCHLFVNCLRNLQGMAINAVLAYQRPQSMTITSMREEQP